MFLKTRAATLWLGLLSVYLWRPEMQTYQPAMVLRFASRTGKSQYGLQMTDPIHRQRSRVCTQLIRRVLSSESVMTSALQMPRMSANLKEVLFQENMAAASAFWTVLNELKSTSTVDPVVHPEELAKSLAEQTAVNSEMVIAAAVVVLSHSTADEVFSRVCAMAMDLDPGEWLLEVPETRKISLQSLMALGEKRVLDNELERFKKEISRKSLPDRADILFRHVLIRQLRGVKKDDPRFFRQSKLKDADTLRHKIVHDIPLLQVSLADSKKAMHCLHAASQVSLMSLMQKYKLHLHDDVFLGTNEP